MLQSEEGFPDVFIVVIRSTSNTRLTTSITNIPPSKYSVLIFELQEDGLPNRRPAYEQKGLNVTGYGESLIKKCLIMAYVHVTESVLTSKSDFLKDANVKINESTVRITCVFKDNIMGALCVLVYRKYNSKTLLVKEYPQNTVFPVTAIVDDDSENYTFAIFGKNSSDFDLRPIFNVNCQVIGKGSSASPTTTPTSGICPCHTVPYT